MGVLKIPFSFYVISFGSGKKIGVFQIVKVVLDGMVGSASAHQRTCTVGQVVRIGQRANGRRQDINHSLQHLVVFQFVAFNDVFDVNLLEQVCKILSFGFFVGFKHCQRHAAEGRYCSKASAFSMPETG